MASRWNPCGIIMTRSWSCFSLLVSFKTLRWLVGVTQNCKEFELLFCEPQDHGLSSNCEACHEFSFIHTIPSPPLLWYLTLHMATSYLFKLLFKVIPLMVSFTYDKLLDIHVSSWQSKHEWRASLPAMYNPLFRGGLYQCDPNNWWLWES